MLTARKNKISFFGCILNRYLNGNFVEKRNIFRSFESQSQKPSENIVDAWGQGIGLENRKFLVRIRRNYSESMPILAWVGLISWMATQIPPKENPEFNSMKENNKDIWIGPPHSISNLRLKIFAQADNLSEEEKYFYLKSKEIQNWNQQYWVTHNTDFQESRKCFIDRVSKENNLSKDESLSPEEMSVFYREFLNRNRLKHITYNWNWYKRNIYLIALAAKVNFSKFKNILRSTMKSKS